MSLIVVGSALALAVLLFAFFVGTFASRRQPSRGNAADSSIWSSDRGGSFTTSSSDASCDPGSSDSGSCDGGGGGDGGGGD